MALEALPHGTPNAKRTIDHSLQRAGYRWHLITTRARAGDDHHRGRGAGAQFYVVWNLLDAHPYRGFAKASASLSVFLNVDLDLACTHGSL